MIELVIRVFRGYFFAGFIFSIVFVLLGVHRIDPDAKGLRIGFRLMIIPGLCIFWPLFAVRWIRGKQTPTERNAHRVAASLAQEAQ